MLEAVEAVPLAPVVAAAVPSESTNVIVAKLISDASSIDVVIDVVISVFDVGISVPVTLPKTYSGPMSVSPHVAAVVPPRTQSRTKVSPSPDSTLWRNVLGPTVRVTGS